MEDCAFLHRLEMQYSQMLFNQSKPKAEARPVTRIPLEALIQEAGCHGATLVFSDMETDAPNAVVVSGDGLKDAYDSFDNAILDLNRPESFTDAESVIEQIFTFFRKVRTGGRILIPESTYCHLPYGATGMEILLHAKGLRIEAPLAGKGRLMIASV